MADGFITRKGGAVGTKAPSINFVSKTDTEIVFTITNNDTATADIFWEVGDSTPEANQLSLAGETTSGNITASGLTQGTEYTIFVFANAANKAGSDTVSLTQTTEAILYIDATGGTTTTYEDNGTFYKSHTFTSSGNFVVNSVGNALGGGDQVDYLIIAGGGGGGVYYGGGGGAGGYRTTNGISGRNSSPESKITVTAQTYEIIVGAGAARVDSGSRPAGNNGNDSSAFGIVSTGGGGGGGGNENAKSGGSGGGATGENGRKNNEGFGISGQGFDGGDGFFNSGVGAAGGGGGGAGSNGQNAPNDQNGGDGGSGLSNTLRTGSTETRAGGGGAAASTSGGSGGTGTSGGGTGSSPTNSATNGQVNTGGGGGGVSGISNSTSGGSGIVIIRYEVGEL